MLFCAGKMFAVGDLVRVVFVKALKAMACSNLDFDFGDDLLSVAPARFVFTCKWSIFNLETAPIMVLFRLRGLKPPCGEKVALVFDEITIVAGLRYIFLQIRLPSYLPSYQPTTN
jgi:hypothetical protein